MNLTDEQAATWGWLEYFIHAYERKGTLPLTLLPRTREELFPLILDAEKASFPDRPSCFAELAPLIPDFLLIVLSERVDVVSSDTGDVLVSINRRTS